MPAFTPVSHQQMGDVEEYRENWSTQQYNWVTIIPVAVVSVILVIIGILASVL